MDADVSSYCFVLLSKVCVRRVCRFVVLRVMLVTSGRVSCFSDCSIEMMSKGGKMLLGNHMVLDDLLQKNELYLYAQRVTQDLPRTLPL
jgi:hypothetical protein